jgi:hypothetical protein
MIPHPRRPAGRGGFFVTEGCELSIHAGGFSCAARLRGLSTASAEALLDRMLAKIDTLCVERDKLKRELPSPIKGKVLGGRSW